ncbi:MAG: hypothetical protein BWY77_00407 [bacterium ADurb.Bin431]|nr:MAG: hypothetical protein BWY77_00407 [bacterium ADurb.Bin431]
MEADLAQITLVSSPPVGGVGERELHPRPLQLTLGHHLGMVDRTLAQAQIGRRGVNLRLDPDFHIVSHRDKPVLVRIRHVIGQGAVGPVLLVIGPFVAGPVQRPDLADIPGAHIARGFGRRALTARPGDPVAARGFLIRAGALIVPLTVIGDAPAAHDRIAIKPVPVAAVAHHKSLTAAIGDGIVADDVVAAVLVQINGMHVKIITEGIKLALLDEIP